MHRRPRLVLVALSALLVLPLAACGGDDAPSEDAGGEARSGERIYGDICSTCHGPDGEGGTGPPLGDGAVEESLTLEEQLTVIREGRNGMPAWEGELTEEEIEDVAVYEREELGR